MKTRAPWVIGKASEFTDLPLNFSQLQSPFASTLRSLRLFITLLLSLKEVDVELGVEDMMLAFSEVCDLGVKGPIAFLAYLGLKDGVLRGWPLEEVDKPGGEGHCGVCLIIVNVSDCMKFSNERLLARDILFREPRNPSIRHLLDPMSGLVEVVLDRDEEVRGLSWNIT